eukprot:Anaeramoba_flamelloidesa1760_5.p1 GENE.a1760_5~~a1760_5.p1  ORF type:complete len:116 (+),score=22.99 a1760_5:211-558(+)
MRQCPAPTILTQPIAQTGGDVMQRQTQYLLTLLLAAVLSAQGLAVGSELGEHELTLMQNGDGLEARITQTGYQQSADLEQLGQALQLDLTQQGLGHRVTLLQQGAQHRARLEQYN